MFTTCELGFYTKVSRNKKNNKILWKNQIWKVSRNRRNDKILWILKVSRNRRKDIIPWKLLLFLRDFVVFLFLDTFEYRNCPKTGETTTSVDNCNIYAVHLQFSLSDWSPQSIPVIRNIFVIPDHDKRHNCLHDCLLSHKLLLC